MMKEPKWKIEWDDAMSVGIPEIDEDHKLFITLMNRFNESVSGRMDIAEVKKRLRAMLDYIERHFADEERLFGESGYPGAADHARIHARVKAELDQAIRDVPGNATEYEWIAVGLKVKQAIIDHILNEDMKYAAYYRNSRAADPDRK